MHSYHFVPTIKDIVLAVNRKNLFVSHNTQFKNHEKGKIVMQKFDSCFLIFDKYEVQSLHLKKFPLFKINQFSLKFKYM